MALADALVAQRLVAEGDGAFVITDHGAGRLAELGLDVEAILGARRSTARACIDWSERRPHVGGALGAALLTELLDCRWLSRVRARGTQGRALRVTAEGRAGLADQLGVVLP